MSTKLVLKRKKVVVELKVEPTVPEPKTAKRKPKNEVIEVPSCPICAEPYTAVVRKETECGQCHKKACIKCVETYMCSSIEDPHCMHCRTTWTRAFLNTICTSTFLNKTYFTHRQTVLLNREKSFLPTYQVVAERELKARDMQREDSGLMKQYRDIEIEMNKKLLVIQQQRNQLFRRIRNVREGREESAEGPAKATVVTKFIRRCTVPECNGFLSSAWKCGLCNTWACPDCFEIKGLDRDVAHTCSADALATATMIRKDTKPCPSCGEMISKIDGCFAADTPVRYLDGRIVMSQYIRIGDVLLGDDGKGRVVIRTFSGKDQLFKISQSHGIDYTVSSKHTLVFKNRITNEVEEVYTDKYVNLEKEYTNNLKGYNINSTISLSDIKAVHIGHGTYYGWMVDTKNDSLSRRFTLKDGTIVRNCDQMWCVSCHTPFSWTSGQAIKTGIVHNPHYFQWLAKGGQHAPQNPGFVPCGGLPNAYHVQGGLRNATKDDRKEILEILRICTHVMDVERHRYERHLDPINNQDVGVQYLLKERTEEDWKKHLAKVERDRQKSNEIRDILDAFNGAAIDLFRRIDTGKTYTKEEATDLIVTLRIELEELRRFSFDAMSEVGKYFNCSVPWINEKWEIVHGTERNRRLKAEAEEKRALEAAAAAQARKAAIDTENARVAAAARGATAATAITTTTTAAQPYLNITQTAAAAAIDIAARIATTGYTNPS